MGEKKRHGASKDKRRGAEPDDIPSERGQSPDAAEENDDEANVEEEDQTTFKDDRRERRRDRHE
jgi:hypothetical protein